MTKDLFNTIKAHWRQSPPPRWLVAAVVIGIPASWLPIMFFARARVSSTTEPRVLFVQDMGKQPKYREQMSNDLFADGRADRPKIFGTVARGQLEADGHYYRGFEQKWDPKTNKYEVTFYNEFPKQVRITAELLQRGQDRFNIYCAVCHGQDGYGDGPVNARAVELQEPKWVPAASLHSDAVRNRPLGHVFNTITNGIRNMPPYGPQIPVEDRWAIVAYVKALQLSQNAPARVVAPERLETIR
jgi:mono/diheme cytochrome c family protein